MESKKLIRLVESFILLPIISLTSLPFNFTVGTGYAGMDFTQDVAIVKHNIEVDGILAFNSFVDRKAEESRLQKELAEKVLSARANAIDAYYAKYNMPLEGLGRVIVEEAEKNNIDWRLIAAISVIESTGGRHACKKVANSFLGWGSCKIGFESKEEAIRIVSWNLGGGNPNTDHHYEGKTTEEILKKYNPPEIVPDYTQKVMRVMEKIGPQDLGEEGLTREEEKIRT